MKQSAPLLVLAAFVAAVYLMESPSDRCKPCGEPQPVLAAGAGK